MAKMVGLSRNLKLQWLNKVVELVLEDLKEEENLTIGFPPCIAN